MMKPVLVAISLATLAAFPGAALSAPVEHDLDLDAPGWTISSIAKEGLGDSPGRTYHELILDASWTKQKKAKAFRSAAPAAASALPLSIEEAVTGNAATSPTLGPRKDIPGALVAPLHANLVSAGRDLLDIGTVEAKPTPSTPTQTSVVPLPGALWMLGSALVAFIGIASRHKL
jgi:hypothetical protein